MLILSSDFLITWSLNEVISCVAGSISLSDLVVVVFQKTVASKSTILLMPEKIRDHLVTIMIYVKLDNFTISEI